MVVFYIKVILEIKTKKNKIFVFLKYMKYGKVKKYEIISRYKIIIRVYEIIIYGYHYIEKCLLHTQLINIVLLSFLSILSSNIQD